MPTALQRFNFQTLSRIKPAVNQALARAGDVVYRAAHRQTAMSPPGEKQRRTDVRTVLTPAAPRAGKQRAARLAVSAGLERREEGAGDRSLTYAAAAVPQEMRLLWGRGVGQTGPSMLLTERLFRVSSSC